MNKNESKKKSILIVDDDDTLRNAIVFDFKRRGYKVHAAKDGHEAFEIVKSEVIDAVITDIRMPRKSGVELLDSIKEVNLRMPVVVFVTGFADLTLEDAYDKGACAVMSKPFERKELIKCIERSLLCYSQKLAQPLEETPTQLKIELKIQNHDTTIKAKLIGIAQGGMFLSFDETLPRVGHSVSFRVEHATDSLTLLQGIGIVRWIRAEASNEFPRGLGIEFIFLDESCRNKVIEFLEGLQVKAFIPKAA